MAAKQTPPGTQGRRRRSSRSDDARPAPWLRNSTLLVTNGGKVIGMIIAIHETIIRATVRDSVLAICALFILGTQAAEDVILHAIDKFFSRGAGADGDQEEDR